jgi:hypothetical protein
VTFRAAALLGLFPIAVFGQTAPSPAPADFSAQAVTQLTPDMGDPMVVRSQETLNRIRVLVADGALPLMRLNKAMQDLQDAMDMSMLKQSIVSVNLLPEQADQLVGVAQRMALRRQQNLLEMQQRLAAGVVSAHEADLTEADFERARTEVALAQSRAYLAAQMAEQVRLEKSMASLETQIDSHPDWNGKVYTKYDGSGIFTSADMQRISGAFIAKFSRPIPISADGETAVHRALGFDHRGRVDIALSPDQPEGAWLLGYLQKNRIPYFAFRSAVPHMATGAHIHLGPSSTRLDISE